MGGPFIDPVTGEVFAEQESAAGPEPAPPGAASQVMDRGARIMAELGNLSPEDASALLHRKHGVSIPSDDPILMFVTLHTRMLEDYQRLLSAHDKAIEAAIKSTASSTVHAVNEALETLKDKTVRAGLNNAMALVERQGMAMEAFQTTTKKHLRVMLALTLSSWLVCLGSVGLIWFLLR